MALTPVLRPGHRATGSVVYACGMGAMFLGQRVLGSGTTAWILTAVGFVAVAGAFGARLISLARARLGDRTGQAGLALLYGLGLASLVAYVLSSEILLLTLGTSLDRHAPSLDQALETLWPALWLAGSLPVLFVELAYRSMRRAPVFERGRLRTSLLAGVGVAFALVFAFATVYTGRITDVRWDVSYFRTAKAGDSTRRIVEALDKPVTITTFFPPTNDVAREVDAYVGQLQDLSPLLKIERYDHALDPGKGRELGVTGNGVIVVRRGTMRRQIGIPLELERARPELRKLDQQVNKTLLTVTRPVRRVYFTRGHDERVFKPVTDTDRRSTLSHLERTLEDEGFDVVELSIAHGLGAEVPEDAAVVVVMGPMKAFLPEEAAALQRYVQQRGGSVLVALDPEVGLGFEGLLAPLGLAFTPTLLANDLVHWRRTGQASDRANVATVSFGTHVSVSTLAKLGMQAPVVFMGAGALTSLPDAKPAAEPVIFSDANTWADVEPDFEPGPTEERTTFTLASAVSFALPDPQPAGRLLVVADADAFGDVAMQNPGNRTLFADSLHWLSRDETIVGEVASEEDVPLTHSKKQDLAWFYLTSFLPPASVLILGTLFTRRRRAERARDEHLNPQHTGRPPEAAATERKEAV